MRHVPFRLAPSLFYINCSDRFITAAIWCGVALSIFAATGFCESFGLAVSMTDAEFLDASVEWREYEFKGNAGGVDRRTCIVSPYHWRLDWQMWFAAMSSAEFHP